MKKQKLPQEKLNELINFAETELRSSGTLTQMVNKIENIAYGNGYRVDRKEVRSQLINRLADECAKELLITLHSSPTNTAQ